MKLVSYLDEGHDRVGLVVDGLVYSMNLIHPDLPDTMGMMLNYWDDSISMIRGGEIMIEEGRIDKNKGIPLDELDLLSPIPFPTSCRDGYAFRQHVETARRNRGVDMIPEFDQFPVFYFTNHNAVFGEGEIKVEDDHLQKLDFELEVAAVIGKEGKNVSVEEADSYIAGYMVMNDFSARVLQMDEMKLNLGPAKGKDFATSFGPWLVTPDELEQFKITTRFGNKYNLRMTAKHNGELISDGNMKDMN